MDTEVGGIKIYEKCKINTNMYDIKVEEKTGYLCVNLTKMGIRYLSTNSVSDALKTLSMSHFYLIRLKEISAVSTI